MDRPPLATPSGLRHVVGDASGLASITATERDSECRNVRRPTTRLVACVFCSVSQRRRGVRWRPGRRMIAALVVAAMAIAAATPGVATGGASAPPRHPVTRLHHGVIQIQGHARTFSYYVPPALPTPSGLVLAFHGGGGTGARLRGFVGASLERMADRFGFMVAYPNGFEGHWNGCRRAARFAANTRDVDDVGFARALIDRLDADHRLDRLQVFALGFSNGAHLAYRLALEVPGEVRAVAAFAANLPEDSDVDCTLTGRPISVMIVNGTDDRINPYAGGEVIAPGGESLGRVRSAMETARYFARIAGHGEGPVRATVVWPGRRATRGWRRRLGAPRGTRRCGSTPCTGAATRYRVPTPPFQSSWAPASDDSMPWTQPSDSSCGAPAMPDAPSRLGFRRRGTTRTIEPRARGGRLVAASEAHGG